MLNTPVAIKQEVSIPYPLYQSNEGHYFIGQTPILTGQDQHALALLVNPITSHVNIYINAITVTNISDLNLSAEVYLKSLLGEGALSPFVSCANLSIDPSPIPEGQIQYFSTTPSPPSNGVPIFSRIVSPYTTLIIDGGQMIIPPGEALTIYLGGYLPIAPNSTIIALGWWEEALCNCRDCCY